MPDDLIALARRPSRTQPEEERLAELKLQMARHVMSAPAAAVYDVAPEA